MESQEKLKKELVSLGVDPSVDISTILQLKLSLRDEIFSARVYWYDVARAFSNDTKEEDTRMRTTRSMTKKRKRSNDDSTRSVKRGRTSIGYSDENTDEEYEIEDEDEEDVEDDIDEEEEFQKQVIRKSSRRNSKKISDDENSPPRNVSNRPLTARQRSMLNLDKVDKGRPLFDSYPEKEKKKEISLTQRKKKEEEARKREQKLKDKLEEEKNVIIEQLLNSQKATNPKKKTISFGNGFLTTNNAKGEFLSFPEDRVIPDILSKSVKLKSYPARRPTCGVCSRQEQKYIHSKFKIPICSLACYRAIDKTNGSMKT